jgi:hypothetical protein
MKGSLPRVLSEDERDQMRRWLENWAHVGPILEAERRSRVAGLTDEEAWQESYALFQSWQLDMLGDSGEGLQLQQDVFARWQQDGR